MVPGTGTAIPVPDNRGLRTGRDKRDETKSTQDSSQDDSSSAPTRLNTDLGCRRHDVAPRGSTCPKTLPVTLAWCGLRIKRKLYPCLPLPCGVPGAARLWGTGTGYTVKACSELRQASMRHVECAPWPQQIPGACHRLRLEIGLLLRLRNVSDPRQAAQPGAPGLEAGVSGASQTG